jgi:primosomal protein N' (replication factor Y)
VAGSGRGGKVAAGRLPVARVAVDVSLPHLDRPFDYLVPERLSPAAVPGCRVRVRFAGRLTGGYLLQRVEASEHRGALAFLERVVSPEPVLTAEIFGLARAVADRYGGTLADVLRLAIPPRHGAAESAAAEGKPTPPPPLPEVGPWARYPAGRSFLAALSGGRAPRAAWSALPGPHWPDEIARAAATARAAGSGVLIVVPDARDLGLVDGALAEVLGCGQHVCLAAGLGPAERYRRWLAVARGQIRVVAGTRSAMFAPVTELGLVVVWDDGDDLHAEPRAPYPHVREVLALRAHRCGAAALIGGFARTAEVTQLVAGGWAAALTGDRATVRQCAPRITATGDDAELARDEAARSARMPSLALRTAREALATGPVLFQVPRRGYVVAAACEHCGARARCSGCGGPLSLAGARAAAQCGWCGTAGASRCARCGQAGLRALVVGAGRTAEELVRAFPATAVRTSGGADVIAEVGSEPARRLGPAQPGQPARVRGGATPVAQRRGAGAARSRWRLGRGRRRRRARAGAGAGALGSGDTRRARAGGAA